jgi:hypothetical protein
VLLDVFGRLDPKTALEMEKSRVVARMFTEQVSGQKVGV